MSKSLASKKREQLVSVVMPVYNSELYLKEAVESILTQTYRHFEFIIVDDASTDSSWNILKKYSRKEGRVKLFTNIHNQGVSKAVKKGIDHAKGQFIARMDADDIAIPDRLKKQIDYLTSHPHTIAVGGQCIIIDNKGNQIGMKQFPTNFKQIYSSIFTFSTLQEPTLMIARHKLPKCFFDYAKVGNTIMEIELIFKLFQYGKVENLPHVLLQYRIHPNNISLKNIRKSFYQTLIGRFKGVFLYGYVPSAQDIAINILQLIIVTCVPQKISLWFYHKIRKIVQKKKQPSNKFTYTFP